MGSQVMNSATSEQIMVDLYERGMFRTWMKDRPEGWTLVSGQWSPFYLQLRELCSFPDLLARIGSAMGSLILEADPIDRIVGVAYAGLPIAIAASLATNLPCMMTRKIEDDAESRQALGRYGQHAQIEGELKTNDRLGLVDDLVTRFDSKLVAARQVLEESSRREVSGVTCKDVFVVIDREQGGAQRAKELGYRLHSITTLKEGVSMLRQRFSTVEYDVITSYLSDPEAFQNSKVQDELAKTAIGVER
jgi:uridine monophosphate synthetase